MTKTEKTEKALEKLLQARERVEQLEEKFNAAFNEERKQVKFDRRGETITLTFGGRVLKVDRNGRGRWRVRENGRVINGDFTNGMYELQVALVRGEI